MNDTKRILGKYISNFIFIGIIIGAITFFIEMSLVDKYLLTYPALILLFVILIFTLSTFLIHMIASARTIGKAILTEEKKKILTKTVRVVLGIIAIIVMFIDYFAFSNLNKSYINDYRNVVGEQLKALVVEGEKTQEEVNETQKQDEGQIHSIIYICMGTKQITNIVVYLAVTAYVESRILRVKNEEKTDKK